MHTVYPTHLPDTDGVRLVAPCVSPPAAAAAAACCCICSVTRSQMSCRIGKTWWGNGRARQRQPPHQCVQLLAIPSPLFSSALFCAPLQHAHTRSPSSLLKRPTPPFPTSTDLLRLVLVMHFIHAPPHTSYTHTHSPSPLLEPPHQYRPTHPLEMGRASHTPTQDSPPSQPLKPPQQRKNTDQLTLLRFVLVKHFIQAPLTRRQ